MARLLHSYYRGDKSSCLHLNIKGSYCARQPQQRTINILPSIPTTVFHCLKDFFFLLHLSPAVQESFQLITEKHRLLENATY